MVCSFFLFDKEKGQNPVQDLTAIHMLQMFTPTLLEHIIYNAWPHCIQSLTSLFIWHAPEVCVPAFQTD